MKQGTVKWFNAEKDSALSKLKEKMTYSYIFQQLTKMVTNH